MDAMTHHDLPRSAVLLPLRARNGNSTADMERAKSSAHSSIADTS